MRGLFLLVSFLLMEISLLLLRLIKQLVWILIIIVMIYNDVIYRMIGGGIIMLVFNSFLSFFLFLFPFFFFLFFFFFFFFLGLWYIWGDCVHSHVFTGHKKFVRWKRKEKIESSWEGDGTRRGEEDKKSEVK